MAGRGPAPFAPAWTVGAVDVKALRAEGWRWEGGLDEDLAEDDRTVTLTPLPGVSAVGESDRGAWLVARDVDRAVVEGAVCGWVAAQR